VCPVFEAPGRLNGRLDGSANPTLDIKTPSRLWIGGWYHNYDFVGGIDEVDPEREGGCVV